MNLLQKAALAVRAALSGPPRPMAPAPRRDPTGDQQREIGLRRKELAEARARLTEELARLDALADRAVKAGDDAAARERLRQASQTRDALSSNAKTIETLEQTEREIRAQIQAVQRGAEKTQDALQRATPAAPNQTTTPAPPPPPTEDETSLRARMDRLRGPG